MTQVFVSGMQFLAFVEMAKSPYDRRRVDMYDQSSHTSKSGHLWPLSL